MRAVTINREFSLPCLMLTTAALLLQHFSSSLVGKVLLVQLVKVETIMVFSDLRRSEVVGLKYVAMLNNMLWLKANSCR